MEKKQPKDKKVPWSEIYKDFRRRYPKLKRMVLDWQPHDYLMISIKLKDGAKLAYDYLAKTAWFIDM